MDPHECQTLADLLTRVHYSLIVDETTDKSSAKVLVMIAKYKHHATLLVKEEFLGLLEVSDGSSEGQKKLIQTYLKDIGVPVSNLIVIAYDNASVNTGVHGGLGALFQESLPHLFTLGCTSHSLALCASYASKFLLDTLELFLKDLINYVAMLPKKNHRAQPDTGIPPVYALQVVADCPCPMAFSSGTYQTSFGSVVTPGYLSCETVKGTLYRQGFKR